MGCSCKRGVLHASKERVNLGGSQVVPTVVEKRMGVNLGIGRFILF